jgi:hypothetical protein
MPKIQHTLAPFAAFLIAACGSSSPGTSPSTPTAAATPTPAASTPPVRVPDTSLPVSCRSFPPATGTSAGCRQEASDFLRQVTDAVAAAQNAAAVDPDTGETFAVLQNGVIQSPSAYLKLIVDALDRQGVCAVYDGEELSVRTSNNHNELFDVITSSGVSWSRYMSTCSPATPLPPVTAPPIQDTECRIPPSRDAYCDRPAPVYEADLAAALDELIAQDRLLTPSLIFDFGSRAAGTDNGWKVANVPLYFSEMRRKMRARGYCSIQAGDDELWIKKGTNRFSEHWDLLRAEGHSLRLLAATCRDAAF